MLEESENEHWQEVVSKKSKLKLKKLAHESANIRAAVDTGAAGHVMRAEMFPRAKLDRTSATKKLVAANGERFKDSGEKTIGLHRCIKYRSASVVKTFISMRKVVRAGNVVVLGEKNPYIRNNPDGTVIKLGEHQ